MESETELQTLAKSLELGLMREHGPMLTDIVLLQALGFKTVDAFRQALSRGKLPVPVFELENRRGKYALTRDVADWLAKTRMDAVAQGNRRGGTESSAK